MRKILQREVPVGVYGVQLVESGHHAGEPRVGRHTQPASNGKGREKQPALDTHTHPDKQRHKARQKEQQKSDNSKQQQQQRQNNKRRTAHKKYHHLGAVRRRRRLSTYPCRRKNPRKALDETRPPCAVSNARKSCRVADVTKFSSSGAGLARAAEAAAEEEEEEEEEEEDDILEERNRRPRHDS